MANDADKLRNSRIVQQSVNPFGTNFPAGVQSQRNKNLVKHNKGDHFHHNRIVDVLAPFFENNTPQESLAMVDDLWSRGITVGNNDLNLTGVPEQDHIKSSGIHQYAIENNIQANKKGFQNTGEGAFEQMKSLENKISQLPFDQKLQALNIFLDNVQPALDEQMTRMGYSQPSREEVAADWRMRVNAEHDEIVKAYEDKKFKEAMRKAELVRQEKNKRIANNYSIELKYSAKNLNKLLGVIRSL